jgi:hypothetical protein
MAMTTTDTTAQLPPAEELERRLQAAREEATVVRRLLKIRKDLDAAAEAERRRAGTATLPPEGR